MCDAGLSVPQQCREKLNPVTERLHSLIAEGLLSEKDQEARDLLEQIAKAKQWDPALGLGGLAAATEKVVRVAERFFFGIERAVLPFVLMSALISAEDKTKEGRLIKSVCIPWFDIVNILSQNPTAAYQIPSDRWEEIIAGAYSRAGFDEVVLTPRSGDLGRDVVAIKRGLGSIRVVDQVKAYGPGRLVTANDVRALYGVVMADGASKGFLTTTSDFAPRLSKDILLSPLIPSRIELVNGVQLMERLKILADLRI